MRWRGRRGALVAVAAVLLLALGGCGGDAAGGAGPGSGSDDASEAAPPATPPEAVPTTPATTPTTAPPDSAPDSATAPSTPDEPSRDPLAELVEDVRIDDEQLLGGDISWPQCPVGMGIAEKRSLGSPLPLGSARFVIIGLTNGPGFHPNPCLAGQVAYARDRALPTAAYAVASYPEPADLVRYADDGPYDGADRLGALANVGYQQARFNVASMRDAGLPSPIVWIDVEPVPDFEWSTDRVANAAVVRGLARGYDAAGYDVGVYSTASLWSGVVGDLELGVPEWRAAGHTSLDEALARCGPDRVIQGGEAVLAQWVENGRDRNVTCPGAVVDLAAWFHRF